MLKQIISRFNLQVQTVAAVEDSFSSTVYKCTLKDGEQVYIKIPYTELKYKRELEAYEILQGKVAIPEMLDYWSGDTECPGAFLLSELRGQPLNKDVSSTVAFQVGSLHASLHNVTPTDTQELKTIQNVFPNWPQFIERQFYSFAEDVITVLGQDLYNLAIDKFEEMKVQLPNPDGPSFIHLDFRPANIIIDGDKVSGIIDFESVRFGSTETDFTKIYRDFLRFDDDIFQAYKEGYNSVRPLIDLEKVLPFYRFADAFNSIGWCKRRGLEKNQVFFDENLGRLKAFLYYS